MEFLKQIQILTAEDMERLPHDKPDPQDWAKYFDENKILITNGVKAWNPFSTPIKWFRVNLNPQLLISQYRFIVKIEDRKVRRNALLRLKRVKDKQRRLCLCGCGEYIPASYNSNKMYVNDAHSKRFLRR